MGLKRKVDSPTLYTKLLDYKVANIQCREKAPFLISYIFAYLSHLNVSDHQTNFNIRQR